MSAGRREARETYEQIAARYLSHSMMRRLAVQMPVQVASDLHKLLNLCEYLLDTAATPPPAPAADLAEAVLAWLEADHERIGLGYSPEQWFARRDAMVALARAHHG
jgi:hypothetical protein